MRGGGGPLGRLAKAKARERSPEGQGGHEKEAQGANYVFLTQGAAGRGRKI